MHGPPTAVRYVARVHTLLVVGTSMAGVLVGGALDPVGQRLADASRAEEEARRAEAALYEAGLADPDTARLEGPTDEDRPESTPRLVAHLLPSGPVPARTAGAALVTGALFGAVADHFGADVVVAPFCVFTAMLVAISVTDLTHRLVPRWIVYPSLALIVPLLVVTSAVDHRWHALSGSVIAGAVAFALFFVVWWFVPRGMGFGDVRLAGVIGFVVGYLSILHAYVAFVVGFLVGTVFGLAVLVGTRSGRRTAVPFAPSLSAGAVVAVLWGGQIAHSLFHTS
jgi:leader peptidase (prepilin peptidase) / N-methyltransferase